MVGVRPTHRRRGILRDLMREQLTEIHEAGTEPLAALTASEPVIYGRFGYGLAADHQEIVVPKASRGLRPVAGIDDVRIRYVDVRETLATCAALRNRLAEERPGMFQHDERWNEYVIGDNVTSDPADGVEAPVRAGRARRRGDRVRALPDEARREGVRRGQPRACRGRRVACRALALPARARPAERDPLRDARRRTTRCWICCSTPGRRRRSPGTACGCGRSTSAARSRPGRTRGTSTSFSTSPTTSCPGTLGKWHLPADRTVPRASRATRTADLTVDVRELGAVYLGRPSLARLGRAGLVEEHTAGALAATSQAFSTSRLPFLDTGF